MKVKDKKSIYLEKREKQINMKSLIRSIKSASRYKKYLIRVSIFT